MPAVPVVPPRPLTYMHDEAALKREIGENRARMTAMLKAREMGHAGLKLRVDAENPTGALRLYESVGFTREFTYVTYHREVSF